MPEKALYQILIQARELIRDRGRWTRGAYARDVNDMPVHPLDVEAQCWCGTGAIIKCGGGAPFGGLRADLQELLRGAPTGIVHTNDDKGHDAVMAMFDRLCEKAREAEVA